MWRPIVPRQGAKRGAKVEPAAHHKHASTDVNGRSASAAQFPFFFLGVLPVEHVPLGTALGNAAREALDLAPDTCIDGVVDLEVVGERRLHLYEHEMPVLQRRTGHLRD